MFYRNSIRVPEGIREFSALCAQSSCGVTNAWWELHSGNDEMLLGLTQMEPSVEFEYTFQEKKRLWFWYAIM